MGGIVIYGRKVTAKSEIDHAFHSLSPPIEVIKGIPFNVDPDSDFGIDDFTREDIVKRGTPLSDRETEIIGTLLSYFLE